MKSSENRDRRFRSPQFQSLCCHSREGYATKSEPDGFRTQADGADLTYASVCHVPLSTFVLAFYTICVDVAPDSASAADLVQLSASSTCLPLKNENFVSSRSASLAPPPNESWGNTTRMMSSIYISISLTSRVSWGSTVGCENALHRKRARAARQ